MKHRRATFIRRTMGFKSMPDLGDFAEFADALSGQRVQRERVVRLALRPSEANANGDSAVANLSDVEVALEGTFRDLDRAVEELRVQNEALFNARCEMEESTTIFRDLFERAPFPYVVTTTATQITYANAATCTFLRRAKNALVRKPLTCFVPLGEREAFREAVLRSCTGGGVASWPVSLVPTGAKAIRCRVQVGLVEARNPGTAPALYWNIAEEHDEDLF